MPPSKNKHLNKSNDVEIDSDSQSADYMPEKNNSKNTSKKANLDQLSNAHQQDLDKFTIALVQWGREHVVSEAALETISLQIFGSRGHFRSLLSLDEIYGMVSKYYDNKWRNQFIAETEEQNNAQDGHTKQHELGITYKVHLAVESRLRMLDGDRAAMKHILNFGQKYPVGFARAHWCTASYIWEQIDKTKNLEVNFYTKNLALAGIYTVCLRFYIKNPNASKTELYEYIGKQLQGYVSFVKKIKSILGKILP